MSTHSQINALIKGNEKILWQGSPNHGIIFRDRDLILIPASVIVLGFAGFVDWLIFHYNVTWLLKLLAVIISIAALQLSLFRFFVDAMKRRNTFFVITNSRVIKQFGVFNTEFRTLPLTNLGNIELISAKANSGYISFGNNNSLFTWLFGNFRSTENTVPGLEMIDDANEVFELLKKLKPDFDK